MPWAPSGWAHVVAASLSVLLRHVAGDAPEELVPGPAIQMDLSQRLTETHSP